MFHRLSPGLPPCFRKGAAFGAGLHAHRTRPGRHATETATARSICQLDERSAKGTAFSGILVGILFLAHALVHGTLPGRLSASRPWLVLAIGGAAAFPLAKTIIESFDGSQSFFERAAKPTPCRFSISGRRDRIGRVVCP